MNCRKDANLFLLLYVQTNGSDDKTIEKSDTSLSLLDQTDVVIQTSGSGGGVEQQQKLTPTANKSQVSKSSKSLTPENDENRPPPPQQQQPSLPADANFVPETPAASSSLGASRLKHLRRLGSDEESSLFVPGSQSSPLPGNSIVGGRLQAHVFKVGYFFHFSIFDCFCL